MKYAFDPELVSGVAALPETSLAGFDRSRMSATSPGPAPSYEPPLAVNVRDVLIPGPKGAPEVAVRLYTPDLPTVSLPGYVYYHGGAFITGDLDMSESAMTRIAAEVGAVVVSVDYRLAPEHPFPAGVEDCYAALVWTAAEATQLGIDPGRLGVGGSSAGGGLAAAVALLARDRGGPALCFQYLEIPELDDRLETPSMRTFTDTPLWKREDAGYSWDYYLGGPDIRGTDAVSPYAAPARAEDLSGLPPAYVTACEFDPFRDEDITYALRLLQAGVAVDLRHYAGTFHGTSLFAHTGVAKRILADSLEALRRGLKA
ncbi:alpha/beta hydrolase [Streptomyces sp. NPDC055037]